jgi:hypothetical protein
MHSALHANCPLLFSISTETGTGRQSLVKLPCIKFLESPFSESPFVSFVWIDVRGGWEGRETIMMKL